MAKRAVQAQVVAVLPTDGTSTPSTVPPTNFHQAAVALALDPTQPLRWRIALLSASAIVVGMQFMVYMAASNAMYQKSCLSNEDCTIRGTFCQVVTQQCAGCSYGYGGSCVNFTAEQWIASFEFITSSTEQTAGVGSDRPFAQDYASHCDACYYGGRYVWGNEIQYNHVAFMSWRDWLTLIFVGFMISLYMSHEVRDIKLCEILASGGRGQMRAGAGWRVAIATLCAMRQFSVLIPLTVSVSLTVFAMGGDVLSVCLNSIALIFILDVDEAIYAHAVPDATRQWLSSRAAVQVSLMDQRAISFVQVGYVIFISASIPLTVASRLRYPKDGGLSYTGISLNVSAVGTVLATLCEPLAFVGVSGARRVATRFAVVSLRFAFGVGLWLVVLNYVI